MSLYHSNEGHDSEISVVPIFQIMLVQWRDVDRQIPYQHLQLLIDLDPNRFWFKVLNNASAHTTLAIEVFANQHHDRLVLVYLPTYNPHLNLIERLWRLIRSQILLNRFFESLSAISEAVVNWLETLHVAQFCSVMRISETELAFDNKHSA